MTELFRGGTSRHVQQNPLKIQKSMGASKKNTKNPNQQGNYRGNIHTQRGIRRERTWKYFSEYQALNI